MADVISTTQTAVHCNIATNTQVSQFPTANFPTQIPGETIMPTWNCTEQQPATSDDPVPCNEIMRIMSVIKLEFGPHNHSI